MSLTVLSVFYIVQKLRQHRVQIVPDGNIRDVKDRRLRVIVDRHNALGTVHAGGKLDRTGYAKGQDQLRFYRSSRQTDLVRGISLSVLDHRAGKAQLAPQKLCQLF